MPPIRIRKKFPTLGAVMGSGIAFPMYSWIMYSQGVSLGMIAGVMVFTAIICAGACYAGVRIIRNAREREANQK